jgi:hypothetical protein
MRSCCAGLVSTFVLAAIAAAQGEKIAAVTGAGDFARIDPTDSSAVLVGPTGFVAVNCLAKDPSGHMWGMGDQPFGNKRICQLDPYHGTATTQFAAYLNTPTGMAFSPQGVLYAVDTSGSAQSYLYYYDLSEPDPQPDVVGVCRDPGGQSAAIYGLTFSTGGVLYGWSTSHGLVTVNANTALCFDVNGISDGSTDIQSLAMSASGALYGVRDRLYAIDLVTGAFSAGPSYGLDVRGAEFYLKPDRGPLRMDPPTPPSPFSAPWLWPRAMAEHLRLHVAARSRTVR